MTSTVIRAFRHALGSSSLVPALFAAATSCSGDPSPPTPLGFSAVQKAHFSHERHVKEQRLQCAECHHETNAARLDTPHEAYLSDGSIDCHVCHEGTSHPREPQACSTCHPVAATDVADETLSAKVVIHRACWRCHPVTEAASAAGFCGSCHGGTKPKVAKQIPPPSLRRKGAK